MDRLEAMGEEIPEGNYIDYVVKGLKFKNKVYVKPTSIALRKAHEEIRVKAPFAANDIVDPHFIWNQILQNHSDICDADREFEVKRYAFFTRKQDDLLKVFPDLTQIAEILPGFSVVLRKNNYQEACDILYTLTNGISDGIEEGSNQEPKVRLTDPWEVDIPEIKEGLR